MLPAVGRQREFKACKIVDGECRRHIARILRPRLAIGSQPEPPRAVLIDYCHEPRAATRRDSTDQCLNRARKRSLRPIDAIGRSHDLATGIRHEDLPAKHLGRADDSVSHVCTKERHAPCRRGIAPIVLVDSHSTIRLSQRDQLIAQHHSPCQSGHNT